MVIVINSVFCGVASSEFQWRLKLYVYCSLRGDVNWIESQDLWNVWWRENSYPIFFHPSYLWGCHPVRSQHCADSERFEGSVPSGAMPSNSVQTDEPSVSDWGAMVRTGLGRFPRWRYWRIYVTCQDHQPLQYYKQNLIQIKPLYNSNQQHSRIIINSFSREHKLSKTSECSPPPDEVDVLWWSVMVVVGRDCGAGAGSSLCWSPPSVS